LRNRELESPPPAPRGPGQYGGDGPPLVQFVDCTPRMLEIAVPLQNVAEIREDYRKHNDLADGCFRHNFIIGPWAHIPPVSELGFDSDSVSSIASLNNGSKTGHVCSIFSLDTWIDSKKMKYVVKGKRWKQIREYDFNGVRGTTHVGDIISSFKNTHSLFNAQQFMQYYKDIRIPYDEENFKFSIFIYCVKWLINSIGVTGNLDLACCGLFDRLINVQKLYDFIKAPRHHEFMVSLISVMMSCQTLEDIYYSICYNKYGLFFNLSKLFASDSVFYTIDVAFVLKRLSSDHSCQAKNGGCYGFLSRDLKWNTLTDKGGILHVKLLDFVYWDKFLRKEDVDLIVSVRDTITRQSKFMIPSFEDRFIAYSYAFKNYPFIATYFSRMKNLGFVGNFFFSPFIMQLVVRHKVEDIMKFVVENNK